METVSMFVLEVYLFNKRYIMKEKVCVCVCVWGGGGLCVYTRMCMCVFYLNVCLNPPTSIHCPLVRCLAVSL